MDSYPDTNPAFPDEHRPNLHPVDPRATASHNPSFDIYGSIDNESCFDLATGTSRPFPC